MLRNRLIEIGSERFQDADTDTRGRAQTRARRNLRSQKKIHRNIRRNVFQHGKGNFKSASFQFHGGYILPSFEDAQVRRDDLDAAIGPLAQDGIEILVDRGAQHRTTKLLIISRQVGTTPSKTNPYWAATDEHAAKPPRQMEIENPRRSSSPRLSARQDLLVGDGTFV